MCIVTRICEGNRTVVNGHTRAADLTRHAEGEWR